ncbi:relaxase/mobilization nuclease domain-containing protein [Nocardia sp. IFM 10818]
MIAKIRRGQKMAGLVTYLLGPGEHNEHRDRHIIAGSPTVMRDMWLGHFDGPGDNEASRETALEVAGEVEIPRRLYQTEVKMKARPVAVGVGGRELGLDVIEPARRGEKGTYRNAPVWHCVLSLMPGEELTDEKWQKVAEAFMDRMGFEGTPDGKTAPARWVAVRHGLSGEHGEGQDHIHIAASLVREDGRKVSTYDYGPGKAKGDWKRADEVCGELEHEFGLQILTSRREGGGMSENSRAELERQKALGTPETERERLRRMVRAVATAADSETEFVRGLRGAGIAVRPRYETGGTAAVNGYSVRLRRNGVEVGPWLGGGKLAKDLTLTALREQQWVDSVEGREDALAAWMNPTEKSERVGWARSEDIEAWKEAGRAAGQWQERLRQIPHHDRAQWAYIAGQAAGAFAAWSETFEGDKPGPFAAAANELARSAQLQRASQRYRPLPAANPLPGASGMGNRSAFGDMARLLLSHPQNALPRSHQLRGRDDDAAIEVAALLLLVMFLLLAMLIAIAVEVARAHRARGELGRAVAVEHMARQHLNPVQTQWESELDARRTQWDRDAAQVFTALAGRAAQRVVDRKSAVESDAAQRDPRTPTEQQNQEAAAAPATRRAYYTELTPDVRAGLRAAAIASRAFGDGDLDPRSWHDEMLDAELAHRRAEIQVLIDDIAERQAGTGPTPARRVPPTPR